MYKLLLMALILSAGLTFGQTYNDQRTMDVPQYNHRGNVTVTGTLGVTGAFAATGNATLSGTLEIDGAVTVGEDITAGKNTFVTTAVTDTVVVAGMLTTDIVVVSGEFTSAVDQQDVLQVEVLAGYFVVHRLASGESALGYFWIRFPVN